MPELGDPTSFLQIADGVPVLSSDGVEIGTLEHVLADEGTGIFDGIIIDARGGPGGWRFADAMQVDELHEHGVILTLDADAATELPEPSANPATMSVDPDDVTPDTTGDKLKRAWDYLSGNY